MTDFVLYAHDEIEDSLDSEHLMYCYANFLKQPLELWMFVPCGYDGNILEDPIFNEPNNEIEYHLEYAYQQAKERCLFEKIIGYNICKDGSFYIYYNKESIIFITKKDTIESISGYNLALTPTALKQLGL